MAAIGILCSVAIVLIGGSIWRGYVISLLWAWFVVATFHVPALSVPAAIGIAIIAGVLVPTYSPNESESKGFAAALASATAKMFLAPLIVLVVARIVRFWMP